jgi:hypothetical protein
MNFPFEMEDRLPIWTALSELYLDTSFDDADLDRIALSLKNVRYGLVEIEEILREEVAPAFSFNLLSVAGEWAFWSEDEVKAIMLQWLEREAATDWRARMKRRLTPRLMLGQWPAIAARLR